MRFWVENLVSCAARRVKTLLRSLQVEPLFPDREPTACSSQLHRQPATNSVAAITYGTSITVSIINPTAQSAACTVMSSQLRSLLSAKEGQNPGQQVMGTDMDSGTNQTGQSMYGRSIFSILCGLATVFWRIWPGSHSRNNEQRPCNCVHETLTKTQLRICNEHLEIIRKQFEHYEDIITGQRVELQALATEKSELSEQLYRANDSRLKLKKQVRHLVHELLKDLDTAQDERDEAERHNEEFMAEVQGLKAQVDCLKEQLGSVYLEGEKAMLEETGRQCGMFAAITEFYLEFDDEVPTTKSSSLGSYPVLSCNGKSMSGTNRKHTRPQGYFLTLHSVDLAALVDNTNARCSGFESIQSPLVCSFLYDGDDEDNFSSGSSTMQTSGPSTIDGDSTTSLLRYIEDTTDTYFNINSQIRALRMQLNIPDVGSIDADHAHY